MTAVQRLELELLVEDFLDSVAVTQDELARPLAAMLRYLVAEGIGYLDFDLHDRCEYHPAYTAATILAHPHDFEPGSLGYAALTLAHGGSS